jgi:hypothetical protein
MANRSSSTKSNSTHLIVRAQHLNAFSQIDMGDLTLQHPTTEVRPESNTSLKNRIFAEHNQVALKCFTIPYAKRWEDKCLADCNL